ncbi:LOW QUALITY PROTEIN: hypothetical protein AM593_02290, partial [Mytilus galloprovincialis]
MDPGHIMICIVVIGIESTCVICLEPKVEADISALRCAHTFHGPCIRKSLKNKQECPDTALYIMQGKCSIELQNEHETEIPQYLSNLKYEGRRHSWTKMLNTTQT